jgi:hypothetical protein
VRLAHDEAGRRLLRDVERGVASWRQEDVICAAVDRRSEIAVDRAGGVNLIPPLPPAQRIQIQAPQPIFLKPVTAGFSSVHPGALAIRLPCAENATPFSRCLGRFFCRSAEAIGEYVICGAFRALNDVRVERERQVRCRVTEEPRPVVTTAFEKRCNPCRDAEPERGFSESRFLPVGVVPFSSRR